MRPNPSFPYEFANPQDWATIAEKLYGDAPQFEHLRAIVQSVMDAGLDDKLAVKTSMFDLLVTERPVRPQPFELIKVYSPNQRTPDSVEIEHLSITGRNDRIIRPVSETVPLFWRFVSEKFGVSR